jgi:hypothetical protein
MFSRLALFHSGWQFRGERPMRTTLLFCCLALAACAAPQQRSDGTAAQQAGQEQGGQSEDAKEREKAYKRGGY